MEDLIEKCLFLKEERLKIKMDFEILKNNGKKLFGKYYFILFRENEKEHNRIGIIVTKKKGMLFKEITKSE